MGREMDWRRRLVFWSSQEQPQAPGHYSAGECSTAWMLIKAAQFRKAKAKQQRNQASIREGKHTAAPCGDGEATGLKWLAKSKTAW